VSRLSSRRWSRCLRRAKGLSSRHVFAVTEARSLQHSCTRVVWAQVSGDFVQQPTPTPTLAPTPTSIPTPTPIPLLVHDQNGLWQIRYSPSLEVYSYKVTLEGEDVEAVSFTRPSALISDLTVTRLVGYGGEFDLPSWSGFLVQASASNIDPFQVVSWEEVTVGENPAYEAVLSNSEFTKIELHLLIGADAYWITGVTSPDRWDETKELLRAMVYSFQPSTMATPSLLIRTFFSNVDLIAILMPTCMPFFMAL